MTISEGRMETMMIYRNKHLAMEAAQSDEVAVRVEGGYMLVSAYEYKVWKRQR